MEPSGRLVFSCWDKGQNGWLGKYFHGSIKRSVRDKSAVFSVM